MENDKSVNLQIKNSETIELLFNVSIEINKVFSHFFATNRFFFKECCAPIYCITYENDDLHLRFMLKPTQDKHSKYCLNNFLIISKKSGNGFPFDAVMIFLKNGDKTDIKVQNSTLDIVLTLCDEFFKKSMLRDDCLWEDNIITFFKKRNELEYIYAQYTTSSNNKFISVHNANELNNIIINNIHKLLIEILESFGRFFANLGFNFKGYFSPFVIFENKCFEFQFLLDNKYHFHSLELRYGGLIILVKESGHAFPMPYMLIALDNTKDFSIEEIKNLGIDGQAGLCEEYFEGIVSLCDHSWEETVLAYLKESSPSTYHSIISAPLARG
jgi:hypothetical protein